MKRDALIRELQGAQPSESATEDWSDERWLTLAIKVEAALASFPNSLTPSDLVELLAVEIGLPAVEGRSDEELSDSLLALACAQGDPGALEALESRYLSKVPAMIAHMSLGRERIDEVQQRVRVRLLVAKSDESPASIGKYAARGQLAGLVQVVATRIALDLLKAKSSSGDDELSEMADPAFGPELSFMKAEYRSAFRAAFESAVHTLPSSERNLLRLHLLDGVTLDALARMYQVHRATVVRRLAKTRERLLQETKSALVGSLQVGEEEFSAVMELIRSRLDVSARRLLQTMSERGRD